MEQGPHYPLYIYPPKKININHKQFKSLSYMGLGSLFCAYRVVIGKEDTQYIMYMHEGTEQNYWSSKRFESVKSYWFQNQSANWFIVKYQTTTR
jgi:hypothetical protein